MKMEIFNAIIGIILVVWGFVLFIGIIQVVGQWKAFKKAGKSGWEAIIPIYNLVVQCQIVGLNPLWVAVYILGGIFLNIIPVLGSLAAAFLSIYFMVILAISTARSYGKEDAFGVGILLLGPIFWPLLGFSKDTQYVGSRPMNDPVWDFFEKTFGGKSSANGNHESSSAAARFCRECGAKVEGDTKFCPECGKEVK